MGDVITPPRLLVSVRNVSEALAAIEGGADILDLKDPSRGSLGMAPPQQIAAVAKFLRACYSTVPLSAALGELGDWHRVSDVPQLPTDLRYLKLGLAGMRAEAHWQHRWLETRQTFDGIADTEFQWIAVAYADWRPANSPPPLDVAAAAIETGCVGVLIDTWQKSGKSLLDWISPEDLHSLMEFVRGHGLMVALAGSLRREHLPAIAPLRPDIVAIRTAACRDEQRDSPIDAADVRDFHAALSQHA